MALTRPRLGQLDTSVFAESDPIAVLHAGTATANVDIGLLMNRANGLVSNVALYWNESGNTFVTAFTSNTGGTDTNISVTSYANVTTGNVKLYGLSSSAASGNITITGNVLPSANISYDLGSPTQRFKTLFLSGTTIDLGGAQITTDPVTGAVAIIPIPTTTTPNPVGIVISPQGQVSTITSIAGVVSTSNLANVSNTATTSSTTTFGNVNVTGNLSVAGTVTFTNTVVETSTETVLGVEIVGGNLVANSGTASTSTTTGALVVIGGAGISGNLNVGGNISATNIFMDRGADVNDWNTLTTMGVYLINRSSWSGTTNTPLNSLYFTGQLEVTNTGSVSITQNYRPYNSTVSGDLYWTRSKYSTNAWSSWVEIINGSETMDGGSF